MHDVDAEHRHLITSVVVILAVGMLSACGGGSSSPPTSPPTTLSLADRTSHVASVLTADLCYPNTTRCPNVAVSAPGAITIVLGGDQIDVGNLTKAGIDSHSWSAADAARMPQTRPIDGTQKSNDGKTTWSYDGTNLSIVVAVS